MIATTRAWDARARWVTIAVVAVAVATSACAKGTAVEDATAVVRSDPAVGAGGGSLSIATSIPGQLNTPLSVPPSGPGVSVTVPPQKPCTIVATISNAKLGFAYDSAAVSPEGEEFLRSFTADVMRNQLRLERIDVVGFASSEGPDDYNLALSRSRAESTAGALATIAALRGSPVNATGRGEQDPVGDNGSELGRASNRRVEVSFHFIGCT